MPEEKKVTGASTLARTFTYSLNGVQLNFTLRVDVKDELDAFAQLLETALADVREEIAK